MSMQANRKSKRCAVAKSLGDVKIDAIRKDYNRSENGRTGRASGERVPDFFDMYRCLRTSSHRGDRDADPAPARTYVKCDPLQKLDTLQ